MPAVPPRRTPTPPPGVSDPLTPLLDLPGVREAVDRARTACEDLRWHEAFRRRWREVRAEADLRAARASAAVDGARVPLDLLRGVATGTAPGASAVEADLRIAAGSLRATVLAAGWRPDLGARSAPALPPLGQMLARLHAAAGAGWLPDADLGRVRADGVAPQDLGGLGPAPAGGEVAERIALLTRTAAATGAPEGVAAWVAACADAAVAGAAEGRVVADAVLAGRLG